MAWFILFTNAQKHNDNPLSIYKNEEFTLHIMAAFSVKEKK